MYAAKEMGEATASDVYDWFVNLFVHYLYVIRGKDMGYNFAFHSRLYDFIREYLDKPKV